MKSLIRTCDGCGTITAASKNPQPGDAERMAMSGHTVSETDSDSITLGKCKCPISLLGILGDNAPARRLTAEKTESILRRDGSQITGFVVTGQSGGIGIIDKSAVRWLTDKEMWWLMHDSADQLRDMPKGATIMDCPECAKKTPVKGIHYTDAQLLQINAEQAERINELHQKCGEIGSKLFAAERELAEAKATIKEMLNSAATLQELHATPGAMEVHIRQNPEVAALVAKCFAELVAKSPNYTELRFDVAAEAGKWITVLVQKGEGKTPHQMRQQAEKERDEAKNHEYAGELKAAADRIAELEKELAEANTLLQSVIEVRNSLGLKLNKMYAKLIVAEKERDEAREENKELREQVLSHNRIIAALVMKSGGEVCIDDLTMAMLPLDSEIVIFHDQKALKTVAQIRTKHTRQNTAPAATDGKETL